MSSDPRPGVAERAVDLHGTVVEWTRGVAGLDPIEPLLRRFPSVSTGAVDLSIDVRPSGSGSASDPAGEGFLHTCFFGEAKGFQRDGEFLLWDGASRVWVSRGGDRMVVEVARERTDPHALSAVMVLVALTVALRARDLFHVHASAVVAPDGTGWLAVGGGGSGKTSTVLALIAGGFGFLGDDAVLVRLRDGAADVLALPLDFHIAPATLAAFPALREAATELVREGPGKRRLDPMAAFPGAFRWSIRSPRVLLFPEIAASEATAVEPLPPADALGRLVLSSAMVAVGGMPRRREHMAALEALVWGGRTLRLRLGQDALLRPDLIASRVRAALGREPGDRVAGTGSA